MKKIKNFYKNLTFTQGAVFAVTLSSVYAIAAPIVGISVFSPGQTISSAAVNNNFNILRTTIEGMSSGQTYVGTYNASSNVPPSSGSTPGEYYIINVAGTFNSESYSINDWTIWDGSTWSRIANGGTIASVFTRTGAIIAAEGDYNLGQLSDVNTTSPTALNGNYLKFDGSQWRAASFPTCAVGEYLKYDGSAFSCVVDNAGAPFTGTASKVMVTDGTGNLSTSTVTSAELNYIAGLASPLQTQLTNKEPLIAASLTSKYFRGDKSFQNLDTTAVTEATNLYWTNARTLGATLTGFSSVNSNINSADTVLQAFNKTQGQLDNKLGAGGGSITSGTLSISGVGSLTVPTPVSSSEAANKGYVDGLFSASGQWGKVSTNINYMSGNVGVGTTSPLVKLHVVGNIFSTGFFQGLTQSAPSDPIFTTSDDPTTGMYFPLANSSIGFTISGQEKIRINSSGFLGIGTTNPTSNLTVAGNGAASAGIRGASATVSIGPVIQLQRAKGTITSPVAVASGDVIGAVDFTGYSTGSYFPGASIETLSAGAFSSGNSPGILTFKTTPNASAVPVERMRIDSAGNVAIGTNTASYMLHVNGTAGGTSAYAVISDIRFKKEVKRIPNALEKLLAIDGVSYNFRNAEFPDLNLSHRRELGVIAQKVEKVFPEAVSVDKKGFRSVAYTMLISPIIEAIRGLDSKQKNLEAENKMLKNYLCTRDPMAPFCEE